MIRPSLCTVFTGEHLSYFFVGRPGYKVAVSHDPSYWQLPAVFIFSKLDKFNPKRIHPFDTGAMSREKYRDIIGKLKIKDFEMNPKWSSVLSIIEHFFDGRKSYLAGKAKSYEQIRKSIGPDVRNFVPLALSKLYNHAFNEHIDDRARLIEIQYEDSIPLEYPSLKAVIMCKEWTRDKHLMALISKLGCKVETYPILALNTEGYYSKIYEIAQGIS